MQCVVDALRDETQIGGGDTRCEIYVRETQRDTGGQIDRQRPRQIDRWIAREIDMRQRQTDRKILAGTVLKKQRHTT